MGPAQFGAFIGMEHIFGAPPKRPLKTAEEIKQEEMERNRRFSEESREYFLSGSVFAKAAEKGRGFTPVG